MRHLVCSEEWGVCGPIEAVELVILWIHGKVVEKVFVVWASFLMLFFYGEVSKF